MRIILLLLALTLLPGCAVVREVVVFPVAAFVWTLDQVDPRPEGPAGVRTGSMVGTVDLFDAKGRRLGYGVQRVDGSTDVFTTDGTRALYVTRGR